jgi:hypothetical protein
VERPIGEGPAPCNITCNKACSISTVPELVLASSRRQNQRAPLPELLTPDYNRPLADIYRDTIRFSLQELDSLYPLRSISHRFVGDSALEGFSSWVPRYDREWNEKEDPAEPADIHPASHVF